MPPILKEKNKYFYATNNSLYKIDILTDYAFVEYGNRLIKRIRP